MVAKKKAAKKTDRRRYLKEVPKKYLAPGEVVFHETRQREGYRPSIGPTGERFFVGTQNGKTGLARCGCNRIAFRHLFVHYRVR